MFGLFGKMFASSGAAKEIVATVKDGLDALVYTDEEKAYDAAQSRREARELLIQWIANSSGQNLARRFIAVTVTLLWAGQYLTIMLCTIASVWLAEVYNQRLIETSELIRAAANQTDGAMMLVLGFYFAAPYMGKIAETALNKFGNREKS